MKLYVASDHAGFDSKEKLKAGFSSFKDSAGLVQSVDWIDLGTHSTESSDYPLNTADFCHRVLADKKSKELLEPQGVLLCGSGIGVSISANRFKGIRAVLALTPEIAALSRQHNAANVVCFGQRVMTFEKMVETLTTFLNTPFEGRGVERHERRVRQMDEIK